MSSLFEWAGTRVGRPTCRRITEPSVRALTLPGFTRQALSPWGLRPARHHILLLRHLTQVAEGDCDRLLVLMPPGSAKSTYASLIFPTWWFHRQPATTVIAASHTSELATQFGRGVRNLALEHEQALGYALLRSNRAAHRFATTTRGNYYACGLGGAIAGRRADLVLIDDPVRSQAEAEVAAKRDAMWNWYRNELLPRLKPRGRVVVVMTRWHEDDIAGRIIAGDESWNVLRLPALAEIADPLGRLPGEPLWPEWEDALALDRKRAVLGESAWAALYQQRPMREGGTIFRPAMIETIDHLPDGIEYVRAWDLAASEVQNGNDPDWTVGLKLGRSSTGRFIVADVVRLREGPHGVMETIVATARRDGVSVAIGLPQDPGQAGKQQVAWLAGLLAGFRVAASPETGSKRHRAAPVATQVELGNLSMLRGKWNRELIDELAAFPEGRKDDQVDALARGFAMFRETSRPPRRIDVSLMAR